MCVMSLMCVAVAKSSGSAFNAVHAGRDNVQFVDKIYDESNGIEEFGHLF